MEEYKKKGNIILEQLQENVTAKQIIRCGYGLYADIASK
jgi:hypothetical protein